MTVEEEREFAAASNAVDGIGTSTDYLYKVLIPWTIFHIIIDSAPEELWCSVHMTTLRKSSLTVGKAERGRVRTANHRVKEISKTIWNQSEPKNQSLIPMQICTEFAGLQYKYSTIHDSVIKCKLKYVRFKILSDFAHDDLSFYLIRQMSLRWTVLITNIHRLTSGGARRNGAKDEWCQMNWAHLEFRWWRKH